MTQQTSTISLTVNGDPTELAVGATIADLLVQMAVVGRRIAVELNGEIVPKADHANTALQADDLVEVVQAIGGG